MTMDAKFNMYCFECSFFNFTEQKYILTPNVSRATIFIGGLNNEKVKVKKLLFQNTNLPKHSGLFVFNMYCFNSQQNIT